MTRFDPTVATPKTGPVLFLFPSNSRQQRLGELASGTVPKDFFYGFLHLRDQGRPVAMADTRQDPAGLVNHGLLQWEILRNRFSNSGLSRQRVNALKEAISAADMALSFTDWFSLSLGLYGKRAGIGTVLAGGFHGLADIGTTVKPPVSWALESRVRDALAGLDHLFFFGETDRQQSIRRFGLDEGKTSLFLFGIDTDFWTPPGGDGDGDYVLSVGSDPSRDYASLFACGHAGPIKVLTRLAADPGGRANIELIRGSYHGSRVTDVVLRDMYRGARIVAVPLKDVWQPTGYSVTLQAMACGKPVILSRIKGLWDPEVFVSGENCLLVPPGDRAALGEAIRRLQTDAGMRARIGAAARETAVRSFPLARMNRSIEDLVGTIAERHPRMAAE